MPKLIKHIWSTWKIIQEKKHNNIIDYNNYKRMNKLPTKISFHLGDHKNIDTEINSKITFQFQDILIN